MRAGAVSGSTGKARARNAVYSLVGMTIHPEECESCPQSALRGKRTARYHQPPDLSMTDSFLMFGLSGTFHSTVNPFTVWNKLPGCHSGPLVRQVIFG